MSATRTYDEALALLAKLASNRHVTDLFQNSNAKKSEDMNLRAMDEMLEWWRRAGHAQSDLARLRCIHVAGTKGKGSTCAFATSILGEYPDVAGRVGTYTSPHLVSVRERIALDGKPIGQEAFTRYFFELWDQFTSAAVEAGDDVPAEQGGVAGPATKPFFFRYLTILAFHIFLREGIKSAVIECGIGGEYDATNILPADAISGAVITQLGIDHVAMLGDTAEKIAWHKAGIIKEHRMAFTRRLDAQPGVMKVLRDRSESRTGSTLVEVSDQDVEAWGGVPAKIAGSVQKHNQALAALAVRHHLNVITGEQGAAGYSLANLPSQFIDGLGKAELRGRHELIKGNDGVEWFLDGAHTTESLEAVAKWFAPELANTPSAETAFVLVFNQAERDAAKLLNGFLDALRAASDAGHQRSFDQAIFTRNDLKPPEGDETRDVSVQQACAEAMKAYSPETKVLVLDNIEAAVHEAASHGTLQIGISKSGKQAKVLVTGSLHLVGGVLRQLEPDSLL